MVEKLKKNQEKTNSKIDGKVNSMRLSIEKEENAKIGEIEGKKRETKKLKGEPSLRDCIRGVN